MSASPRLLRKEIVSSPELTRVVEVKIGTQADIASDR